MVSCSHKLEMTQMKGKVMIVHHGSDTRNTNVTDNFNRWIFEQSVTAT